MEKIMANIKMTIEEDIEMEFYAQRDMKEQFRVTFINGEPVAEDDILLVSLNDYLGNLRVSHGLALRQMDKSNYLGKLEVFYCKKKKGIFGRESLKVINSCIRPYHISGIESGEEKKTSLLEMMK